MPSKHATNDNNDLTIVLCGGGSGGHIIPTLAVAHELKQLRPNAKLIYILNKGEPLSQLVQENADIDSVYFVRAGKWRRYHSEGWRQLLDIPTLFKNLIDLFWTAVGFEQSLRLLGRLRPAGLFMKGGFVCLPVGLAAGLKGLPFITHDSDAVPGLANRLIKRWAKLHAVGMPKELYKDFYPTQRTVYTGVPVSHDFQPVDVSLQKQLRQQIGLDQFEQMVLVTGGGLGALRLSQAMVDAAPQLLAKYPNLVIVDNTGAKNQTEITAAYQTLLPANQRDRVQVKGFLRNLYAYSGAADVVVARAGATTMAELAAQHKACVLVPNPLLTGGHQSRNAEFIQQAQAAVIIDEAKLQDEREGLRSALEALLNSKDRREQLSAALGALAKTNVAHTLAELLISVISEGREDNVVSTPRT